MKLTTLDATNASVRFISILINSSFWRAEIQCNNFFQLLNPRIKNISLCIKNLRTYPIKVLFQVELKLIRFINTIKRGASSFASSFCKHAWRRSLSKDLLLFNEYWHSSAPISTICLYKTQNLEANCLLILTPKEKLGWSDLRIL